MIQELNLADVRTVREILMHGNDKERKAMVDRVCAFIAITNKILKPFEYMTKERFYKELTKDGWKIKELFFEGVLEGMPVKKFLTITQEMFGKRRDEVIDEAMSQGYLFKLEDGKYYFL